MKKILFITFLIFNIGFSFGQVMSVSSIRENNIYMGIDNAITIVIENMKCTDFSVYTNNGEILKMDNNDCSYIIRPARLGRADIHAIKTNGKDTIKIGTCEFRVKNLPKPCTRIAGKKGGIISKNELSVQSFIKAELENFDINIHYKILNYSVLIIRDKKTVFFQDVTGNKIPDDIKIEFSKLQKDDRVYFIDVNIITPDGRNEEIEPVKFTIN